MTCESLARRLALVGAIAAAVAAESVLVSAQPIPSSSPPVPPSARADSARLHAPAESTIPPGPLGEAVRLGRNIFNNPNAYAKAYVGNGLTCSNCHINGGTQAWGGPIIGVWGVFPAYSERSSSVETLEDRLNDCFVRSMNGQPLPLGSAEMKGLLAYAWWLSAGVPTGKSVVGRGFERATPPSTPPDPVRGKALFAAKCAACHGVNGQGTPGANGAYLFPPLWGPDSFNLGAGMARLVTAASFVQTKMPLGAGGSLSVRDAYDVAAYFTREPRPDFAGSKDDWPKGGKPADTRY